MLSRRGVLKLSATTALIPALMARPARAQAWPSRFVRLVVPFPAGGGIDSVARIVAAKLSEAWNQQVVIDNRGGAGGNIAADLVARAEPDGYTMFIGAIGLAVNRFLFPSISYDPVADFAPVSLVCVYPNILVVPKASPVHSVQDFIALAKAGPGKLTFGSAGYGSSLHLSGELFKRMAGVDIRHVPYRGASQAFSDLIPARIDAMFAVMASGLPLVREGQLRALAVTTAERVRVLPDVPTIAEAGVPGYDTSAWFAFFVPAKTWPAIIQKMHADTVSTLADTATKDKLEHLGVVVVSSTPEQLASHLKAEMDKWGPVIRDARITIDLDAR